uniref:Uncharacterized protein n=1 Tax=Vespula pensylvanica TaxID=30213 RepID=A0A834KLT3_VESPE|nr:hypothetical protein H0235_013968 [Vespula pensylvanica]
MGKRVYTLLVKSSTHEIGFRRDSRLIQRIVERRRGIEDGDDMDMEYGAVTSATSAILVTKASHRHRLLLKLLNANDVSNSPSDTLRITGIHLVYSHDPCKSTVK